MDEIFDSIVLGAGSAGCVLANRLSEDPHAQVLVVEAGGWDRNPLIAFPFGARAMTALNLYNWGDFSEPDAELGGRRMEVLHGRVVGGTSSLNYMAYTRGHPADYADWVARGAEGWAYEDVLPFFRACETYAGEPNRWRGSHGELGVRAPMLRDPIVQAFLDAAADIGQPLTPDYNGEVAEGFGRLQYTLRDGRRSSAARAFLRPALGRRNLTVRTRAVATRLLFEGDRAVGVEYRQNGRLKVARARERVVLSLGAINSPHLLMLSGIGPADQLRSVGIKPRVDLPVGRNLEDHLGVLLYWRRKSPGAFHRTMRADQLAFNLLRAFAFRDGPAAELPASVIGFSRSRPDLAQPDVEYVIPSSSPFAAPWFPGVKPAYADGFMIRPQIVGQRSRGEVRLTSSSPDARPSIRYNSLSAPEDLVALREGVRLSVALAESSALDAFRGDRAAPIGPLETDEEVDAFIRSTAIQLYHPASTCPMGQGGQAVLNPDLSVRGVEGLYVVDASSMPRLISGNPNGVIIMMAARAASLWLDGAPGSIAGEGAPAAVR